MKRTWLLILVICGITGEYRFTSTAWSSVVPVLNEAAEHLQRLSYGYNPQCGQYHIHHPPDPVNLRNQNFYLPSQDLYFPCYGFPTEIRRMYNATSDIVGPFGIGWTYNLNIRLFERDGYIEIHEEDGFRGKYIPEDLQDKYKRRIIDRLVQFTKERHKQNEGRYRSNAYYASLKRKLRSDLNYYNTMKDHFMQAMKTVRPGKYVSTSRGTSFLTKYSRGGYLRETLNGRKDYFNASGYITLRVDRNGNKIEYRYDGPRLIQMTDPCGRKIRIGYHSIFKNQIATITDHLGRTLRYVYDKKGRLIKFYDAQGRLTEYGYNKLNLMVKVRFPTEKGPIYTVYDRLKRVIRQTSPDGKVTNYTFKLDPRNRNHYRVTAKNNKGYVKSVEYFEDEYKIIERETGKPTKITKLTACCGKPESITDKQGRGVFFKYDKNNNLRRRYTSEGQTTEYRYEPKFSQISYVRSSDGLTVYYKYDNYGNLIKATSVMSPANKKAPPPKQVVQLSYNKRGKIAYIKKSDDAIQFQYNYFGKPTVIEKVGRGKIIVAYDELGTITKITSEKTNRDLNLNKQELIKEIKYTLMEMLKLLKPTGLSLGI